MVSSQIKLDNPSFEDTPADATTPMGWFECTRQTTPDILPGFWGVYQAAADGDSYLGMISRADGSWEGIGQRLPDDLQNGICYKMKLDLAHSFSYAAYTEPLKVRIWISREKCGRDQLIFESPMIEHINWRSYQAEFTPMENAFYISIEVFVNESYRFSHRGNILVDNISPIIYCGKA